ncbi:MAG TPA: class II aldolase/adducin family protein [Candidatus Sulfotelmatobacter sp.]|nr:class II aldolase/adducin family protein [Candidatus Sulfotelmatobacter sp.]
MTTTVLSSTSSETLALPVRQRLALALRVLAAHGIADLAAGHVTVREPGTATWWTNPWDHLWPSMRASDLVRVDASGRVVEGTTAPSEYLEVHFALYQRAPELACVVHNHPRWALLFAASGAPLLTLDQQSALFFERHVVYDEYRGLARGADKTLPAVEAMLAAGAHTAYLRSHGLVVCGESLETALFRTIYAERAAELSCRARMSAGTPIAMDEAVARATRDSFERGEPPVVALNAAALYRDVLRTDPTVLA